MRAGRGARSPTAERLDHLGAVHPQDGRDARATRAPSAGSTRRSDTPRRTPVARSPREQPRRAGHHTGERRGRGGGHRELAAGRQPARGAPRTGVAAAAPPRTRAARRRRRRGCAPRGRTGRLRRRAAIMPSGTPSSDGEPRWTAAPVRCVAGQVAAEVVGDGVAGLDGAAEVAAHEAADVAGELRWAAGRSRPYSWRTVSTMSRVASGPAARAAGSEGATFATQRR